MSTNLFRTSILFTGFAIFLVGTSAAHAARQTPPACEGLDGSAFGLCRAAVASGCASGDANSGSRYCSRLSTNFTKQTGLDPVWLASDSNEQEEPSQNTGTDTTVIDVDLGLGGMAF